ncbi:MAG: response regulator, partial [Proteobacteria bacterium]|nr:response regulator [Pseudomonadota bacterium]
ALENAISFEKLNKERNYTASIINNSSSLICGIDSYGATIFANPAALETTGYSQGELIGQNWWKIFYPKGEHHQVEKFFEASKKGDVKNHEMIITCNNGSKKNILWNSFFKKSGDSHLLETIKFGIDITERKQAEKQLVKTTKKANMANKIKSEFLANMSHEIRTPLNAVLGFTDLLVDHISDPVPKSYLKAIKDGGRGLLTIINDILDISKIEAGAMKINYESVDVRKIFDQIENIFSLECTQKKLTFMVKISSNLPQRLLLDEVRLRQIVMNLVGNAIKFTEQGFISLTADILNSDEKAGVVDLSITVKDSGIGIASHTQQKIFDSFQQSDSQNIKQFGGTGLGLSISKRLVEMMGGKIKLESKEGEGSEFKVVLTKIKVPDTIVQKERKDPLLSTLSLDFKAATVLVVDDQKSNIDLVIESFTNTKLSVFGKETWEEAMYFTQKHIPSLIFMDIKMPEMDGFELTKTIKENPELKDIPIVALTASVTDTRLSNFEKYGFSGCLRKPVSKASLYKEASKYLETLSVDNTDERQTEIAKDPISDQLTNETINEIELKFNQKWENLQKKQSIKEVKKFGEEINTYGKINGIMTLQNFGRQLLDSVKIFDISNMRKILGEYPAVIKALQMQDK